MPGERRLYQVFKSKIQKEYPSCWIYKIPDTFGIGGKRPFDMILIIKGIPFAIEFKAKDGILTKYQSYQMAEFIVAGGEALTYWEGKSTMDDFITEIITIIYKRKEGI